MRVGPGGADGKERERTGGGGGKSFSESNI